MVGDGIGAEKEICGSEVGKSIAKIMSADEGRLDVKNGLKLGATRFNCIWKRGSFLYRRIRWHYDNREALKSIHRDIKAKSTFSML